MYYSADILNVTPPASAGGHIRTLWYEPRLRRVRCLLSQQVGQLVYYNIVQHSKHMDIRVVLLFQ
jgi:hypothetical protein